MLVKHSHRAYLQQKSPVTCMQAHHALSSQSCLSFLQSVAKDMQQCHLEVGCLPSVQRLRPCAVRILALSPINGASTTSLDNVGPCLTTPVIIKEKKKKVGVFFSYIFSYIYMEFMYFSLWLLALALSFHRVLLRRAWLCCLPLHLVCHS